MNTQMIANHALYDILLYVVGPVFMTSFVILIHTQTSFSLKILKLWISLRLPMKAREELLNYYDEDECGWEEWTLDDFQTWITLNWGDFGELLCCPICLTCHVAFWMNLTNALLVWTYTGEIIWYYLFISYFTTVITSYKITK